MRLAHISDLHVLDTTGVSWTRYMNKRLTGLANLWTLRRHGHPVEIFDALMQHLQKQAYDHVALTGDISNLALESEFERAKAGLSLLGGPQALSLVPGNHDAYTRGAYRSQRFESYFGEWMPQEPSSQGAVQYPIVKRLGDITIIALSSAVPTPPIVSRGTLGTPQLSRLAQICQSPEIASTFTVVLVHHNIHARSKPRKDRMTCLTDRDALIDTLFVGKVNLLLHGHTHTAHRLQLQRNGHTLSVIGCGSSTWSHQEHPARYNIYDIEKGEITRIESRVFDFKSGTFPTVGSALSF